MKLLKNLSIRHKQTLVIMLTSSLALLLACSAFVAYDTLAFRHQLVDQVSALAGVIGNNCAAAIDFNDPKSAAETLAALAANKNIVSACAYGPRGEVFATYERSPGSPPPPRIRLREDKQFTGNELHLWRPIKQSGLVVGTIFVASDLNELSARLARYINIVAIVFATSLLVAFIITSRLQHLISDPILHLHGVTRAVAVGKDYSVRAIKRGEDELGQLMDGFNDMLSQIQQHDANLERRVSERTRELEQENSERKAAEVELAYERELLRSLMDRSLDCIYFKDRDSRFIRCSSSLARKLGLQHAEEAIGKRHADFLAENQARESFEDEQAIVRTGQPLIGKTEKETWPDGSVTWSLTNKMALRNQANEIIGTFGISKDITAIKETEAKLNEAHKQLLETSRQAGMAEVATGVLHNVGNVLNSVNVSSTLVIESLRKSRVQNLAKAVALMHQQSDRIGEFLSQDIRGKQLPLYLSQLAEHLAGEQAAALAELTALQKNIGHIKEIVAMQQSYARVSGVVETLKVSDLVEDAVRMNASALERHDVRLLREYDEVPAITVEKHKVLQILVNLIRNAKYACDDSRRSDRLITLRIQGGDPGVKISVTDNGIGIVKENLVRIFNHGFTTRKEGHGFGLHSGALAARELGGALLVKSDGTGKGAVFTLELPLHPPSATTSVII